MTTAVAELPAATLSVEMIPAEPRPQDRYRWLAAQHDAFAKSLGAGRVVPGVDLGGIDAELANKKGEVRVAFISHVENIYDHQARIQIAGDPARVGSMDAEVQAFRDACAKFMLANPGLQSDYERLFDHGRAFGINQAVRKLASEARQAGATDSEVRATEHDLKSRMEAECNYSFEHVLAFDQRKPMRLAHGRNQGRAMKKPDHGTHPPAVARVLNAGIADPAQHFPILEDGRLAQDPRDVVYERILPRDRRR